MSYSYYLLHGLTLNAAFLVLGRLIPPADYGSWLFWALFPPMFVVSLVPTGLLFLTVERPFSLAPRRLKASLKPPSRGGTADGPV
jgi:peptidoglycan/LPS O-acetylase OafA/YrhL